MKTVVYSCPFVPAEWIAAHGLRPSRIVPRAAGESLVVSAEVGVCPYARAFVTEVCSLAEVGAAVFTTVCDQMRRAPELAPPDCDLPVFLMNVPATWQSVGAQKLYRSELGRLGRFLVRLGGAAPSSEALADVMDKHDRERSKLRAARGRLPARAFSEAIARFHRNGTLEIDGVKSAAPANGVPLALVGGPLLAQHFGIFDTIEGAGGTVALDATTTGERSLPAPFDRRRLRDDPLGELADAYFGHIPDAFRRPNSELYCWLKREIADRGVRGIVFWYHLWCDTWHGEAQRMKEWAETPLVILEASDDGAIDAHAVSRMQSLVEMLG